MRGGNRELVDIGWSVVDCNGFFIISCVLWLFGEIEVWEFGFGGVFWEDFLITILRVACYRLLAYKLILSDRLCFSICGYSQVTYGQFYNFKPYKTLWMNYFLIP